MLNRYMFERGNSYKHIDPDGHIIWPLFILMVAGGITIGSIRLLANPFRPSADASPEQVQRERVQYTIKQSAQAGVDTATIGLTSGYSVSGGMIRYAAPSLKTLVTVNAGSSMASQYIDSQSVSVGQTVFDTGSSLLLDKAFTPAVGGGWFLPTQNVNNDIAVNLYYNTFMSSYYGALMSEANEAKNSGSSGGSSSGGSSSQ